MKIGELSKKTGCKVVTIRYYEKEGLMPSPERTCGNYRVYSRDDLERLEFIVHCRRHGIALDEIKKLLLFRDQPHNDCTWVSELLRKHIRETEEKIASLKRLKKSLQDMDGECDGGLDGTSCPIMKHLNSGHKCSLNEGECNALASK